MAGAENEGLRDFDRCEVVCNQPGSVQRAPVGVREVEDFRLADR